MLALPLYHLMNASFDSSYLGKSLHHTYHGVVARAGVSFRMFYVCWRLSQTGEACNMHYRSFRLAAVRIVADAE
jgi:hypothetical protein